jgi:cytochrome c3-like protein
MRQQIQANAFHLLGLRDSGADFAYRTVDNIACLACHARPNDRHPVFRFLEPRFEKARLALGPHLCMSCHREHTGRRVSVEPTYCAECHRDLNVHDDPLEESHAKLASRDAWDTCLQCHDFHGNHRQAPPRSLRAVLPAERVLAYLANGPSPYPAPKTHTGPEASHEPRQERVCRETRGALPGSFAGERRERPRATRTDPSQAPRRQLSQPRHVRQTGFDSTPAIISSRSCASFGPRQISSMLCSKTFPSRSVPS